jgi:hypothetical protein
MDDNAGTFLDDFQVAIGDNGGNLQDDVFPRIQAGHFQVDPDQIRIHLKPLSPFAKGKFSDSFFNTTHEETSSSKNREFRRIFMAVGKRSAEKIWKRWA